MCFQRILKINLLNMKRVTINDWVRKDDWLREIVHDKDYIQ